MLTACAFRVRNGDSNSQANEAEKEDVKEAGGMHFLVSNLVAYFGGLGNNVVVRRTIFLWARPLYISSHPPSNNAQASCHLS